jgi:hypothetical protein
MENFQKRPACFPGGAPAGSIFRFHKKLTYIKRKMHKIEQEIVTKHNIKRGMREGFVTPQQNR